MSERNLFVRVLTLVSILIAIVVALYLYEIYSIKSIKVPKSSPSGNTGASDSAQVVGPGNCVGIDQCLQFCQDHPDECAKTTKK